jgi:hypothetical protein
MATSAFPYVLGAAGIAALAYIFLSPSEASAAEITASAQAKGDADGCAAGAAAPAGKRDPVADDTVLAAGQASGDSKAYLQAWAAGFVRCLPAVTKDVVPPVVTPAPPKPPAAKPTAPTAKLLDRVTANNDWIAGCKLGAKYGWKAACEGDGDYSAPGSASAAKKAGYYYSYSAGKSAYIAGMPCDFSTDSVFSCADSASETAFSSWYEAHKVVSAGVGEMAETGITGWGHEVDERAREMNAHMAQYGSMHGFHASKTAGTSGADGISVAGRAIVGMRRAPVELASGCRGGCGGSASQDSTIYRSY